MGFGLLDASFDFANIVEVISEPRAVTRAQPALQILALFGDRVKNATFTRDACRAAAGSTRLAENALEYSARVRLHGQRRSRRAPGDGVHVGAAKSRRAT